MASRLSKRAGEVKRDLVKDLSPPLAAAYSKLSNISKKYDIEMYLVGGAVRDLLMGQSPKDLDFMIPTKTQKQEFIKYALAEIPGASLKEQLGTQFLVDMLVIDGIEFEIALARKEKYADDSRNPVTVEGTKKQDAERRDFGINALFYDVRDGEILDMTGHGLQDIKDKVIRAAQPGQENRLISEDPLRMFRAIRFFATKGFELDEDLKEAIKDNVGRLQETGIAKERVMGEINKILQSPNAAKSMELIRDLGLWNYAFKDEAEFNLHPWEMEQGSKHHELDVLKHSLLALQNLDDLLEKRKENPRYDLSSEDLVVYKLAMLFHDMGKLHPDIVGEKEDGFQTFYGHEKESAKMAKEILTELSYPNAIIDAVVAIIEQHMNAHQLIKNLESKQITDKSLRKMVRKLNKYVYGLFDVAHADASAKDYGKIKDIKPYEEIQDRIKDLEVGKPSTEIAPLINGHELMQYYGKTKGGPWLGQIQQFQVDDVLLDNPDISKDEMWDLIKEKFPQEDIDKRSFHRLSLRSEGIDPSPSLMLSKSLEGPLETIRKVATDLGIRIFIVGGTVRDMVLGEAPSGDLDILVETKDGDEAIAQRLEKLYPNLVVDRPKKGDFPSITIIFEGNKVDLSTPHKISGSGKNVVIEDATLKEDAQRRDFGINAFFYDLINDRVLDLGGNAAKDMKDNVLRLQQPSEVVFLEDPRTPLKAVRLAIIKGFDIDPQLKEDIKNNVDVLNYATQKDIHKELDKILYDENSQQGLLMLEELGILEYLRKFQNELGLDEFILDPQSPMHTAFKQLILSKRAVTQLETTSET